jgi:undecaprenyl pyrophosphate phosphatase UppP
MRRFHLVLGIVLVIVFLFTGQYMEYVHNRALPDATRLLYRSRHIYVLCNAMINIVLGLYVQYSAAGSRRSLQIVGSVLIMLAPLFLLTGFFYEPPRGIEYTTIARQGVFATAIGILLHLVSASRRRHG